GGGEAPVVHGAPKPVTCVAYERVPCRSAACIARCFLDLFDASKQSQRLEPRLITRETAGLQTFDLAIQMDLQLLAQIGFAAIAEQNRSQPAQEDVPQP